MRTLIISLFLCVVMAACSSHKHVVASRSVVTDSVAARSVSSMRFSLDSVFRLYSFEFDSLELTSYDLPVNDSLCSPSDSLAVVPARYTRLRINGGKTVSQASDVAATFSAYEVRDSVSSKAEEHQDVDSESQACGVYDPPDFSVAFALLIIVAIAFALYKLHDR